MIEYPFKTQPMAHQLAYWRRHKADIYAANFMEMGCGKSWCSVNEAAWLYDQGLITGWLIVAPKGVYSNWLGEILAHMPEHVRYRWSMFDSGAKKVDREALRRFMIEVTDDLRILTVNVESMSQEKSEGKRIAEAFLLGSKAKFDVDESTCIKNPSAARTKVVVKLGQLAAYRRILCGDPYANNPLDIYSQCQFLDPSALGFGSYFTFRARFANMVDMKMPGMMTSRGLRDRTFKKITGYRDLDELKRIVSKFAFTVKKDECLDLPPKVYLPPRYHEMTPKQTEVYRQMKKFAIAELEQQFVPGFDVTAISGKPESLVTADIVLTKLLRLQQIACGFVTNDAGEEVDLCDGKNPRIQAMLDAIEEGGRSKTIIWATFRRSIDEIIETLTREYGPRSAVRYDGAVTDMKEIEEAKRRFQEDPECLFFVGTQAKGGRGITLTAARLMLYFANSYDAEHRNQSEDRGHRRGLSHSLSYQDLRVRGSEDEKVCDALRAKKSLSDLLRGGSWRDLISEE